jgi:hypothetical protein
VSLASFAASERRGCKRYQEIYDKVRTKVIVFVVIIVKGYERRRRNDNDSQDKDRKCTLSLLIRL